MRGGAPSAAQAASMAALVAAGNLLERVVGALALGHEDMARRMATSNHSRIRSGEGGQCDVAYASGPYEGAAAVTVDDASTVGAAGHQGLLGAWRAEGLAVADTGASP